MRIYFGAIRRFWPTEPAADRPAAERSERYTPAERDAILLRFGEPGESLAISDRETSRERPWRFAGALQPPFC